MGFFSPLEQFELVRIIPMNFLNFNLSVTNSTVFIFLILALIFLGLASLSYVGIFILKSQLLLTSNFFSFSRSLIVENIGVNYIKFLSLIVYLFMFIFFANILGMVPYAFTVTSQFIFTFTIALIYFFGATYIGLVKHRLKFFGLFLPEGAPLVIMPFIVTIEIISYLARVFSLSIRLFANMMAGHTLLNILAWFCWSMILAFGL